MTTTPDHLKLARDALQSPTSRGPTWALIENYADAVCEYNAAVRIDVGIDKAGAECLRIEKELRAHLAALAAIDALPDSVPASGYSAWIEHCRAVVKAPMTLAELRADCGRLATVQPPAPEVLLMHAMLLLDRATAQAAPAPAADLAHRLRAMADLRRLEGDHDEADLCDEAVAALAARTQAPAAPAVAAPEPLTDERLNATGLDYALSDALSSTKSEWVMQDIADAFKAGVRSAEKHYGIAAPTTQEPPQ